MATISGTTPSTSGTSSNQSHQLAFALITVLFFMFGFITCLNDILVPHLKTLFDLDYTRAALIQFCFFAAYFIVSLPAGKLVTRVGYQTGTVIGLLGTAVGCALFYPAASMRSYPLFLFGLFVLASGITLIQVAVNPYIAILGPRETSSMRLTLAQAFNSLGTTLAPLFGSALILSAAVKTSEQIAGMNPQDLTAYRIDQASAVQGPYLVLALALVVLAGLVYFRKLPHINPPEAVEVAAGAKDGIWHYRHLVLGAVGIFCYVGAEVAIGSYLINYLGLADIMAMPEATAGQYVALYWGGAMVGRFVGSAILKKVSPSKVLAVSAAFACVLVLLSMLMSGGVAAIAILAVGLFNSIMFPTIFTLAIDGLGPKTAQGAGILCMAIVGGAVIPLFQGMIADQIGLHHSFWLPIACYIFIVYYGLKGSAPKKV